MYDKIVHDMLEPIIKAEQMELYDIEYLHEYGRWVLRLYIDKENGVTLDDCERINNVVMQVLDINDPIPNPYVLEVSSPGIERKLIKDKHFIDNIGKPLEIRLKKPFSVEDDMYEKHGKRKKFRGVLVGLENDAVVISNENADELRLPRELVAVCRLIYSMD